MPTPKPTPKPKPKSKPSTFVGAPKAPKKTDYRSPDYAFAKKNDRIAPKKKAAILAKGDETMRENYGSRVKPTEKKTSLQTVKKFNEKAKKFTNIGRGKNAPAAAGYVRASRKQQRGM